MEVANILLYSLPTVKSLRFPFMFLYIKTLMENLDKLQTMCNLTCMKCRLEIGRAHV